MLRSNPGVVVVLVAGCGRVGFDPVAGGNDGPASDGPFISAPFGGIRQITELSSPDDDEDPTLTEDLLEIYFRSTRNNPGATGDIWRATRTDALQAWPAPELVVELSTADDERTPEISGDGLTIYISSDRPGGLGNDDIYVATRVDRGQPWSAPVPVVELNSPRTDASSAVDPSGLHVVLHSYRDGASNNLYEADRPTTTSAWTTPVSRDELQTANSDINPFLMFGARQIWWTSERAAPNDFDIFIADRAAVGDPFGSIRPVAELNTVSTGDSDPWLTGDGRVIYFQSNRTGDEEIFTATR